MGFSRVNVKFLMTGVCLLVFFGLPSSALANVGTPLMWMPGIRLVFLNVIIGIGEGLIISLVFRIIGKKGVGILRCMGIMILANYFSMLFGEWVLLRWIGNVRGDMLADEPLYNAPDFITFMAICALVLTIILEWPFCYRALKDKKRRVLKSLAASPLLNVLSYAFLAWAYFSMSSVSIYTELDVTRDLSFAKNKNAWIYYISTEDGDVYRIHPDGTSKELFKDVNIEIPDSKYGVSPSLLRLPSEDGKSCDLWLAGEEDRILVKNFSECESRPVLRSSDTGETVEAPKETDEMSFIFYYRDFTEDTEPAWILSGGYWAIEGIYAENKKSEESFRAAFETPFIEWNSSHFNYVDGDQVIYQLGKQIVLLDLDEKKIGLITAGVGPLVTLD